MVNLASPFSWGLGGGSACGVGEGVPINKKWQVEEQNYRPGHPSLSTTGSSSLCLLSEHTILHFIFSLVPTHLSNIPSSAFLHCPLLWALCLVWGFCMTVHSKCLEWVEQLSAHWRCHWVSASGKWLGIIFNCWELLMNQVQEVLHSLLPFA